MLNFADRTRSGVFNVVWPLAREEGKNDCQIVPSDCCLSKLGGCLKRSQRGCHLNISSTSSMLMFLWNYLDIQLLRWRSNALTRLLLMFFTIFVWLILVFFFFWFVWFLLKVQLLWWFLPLWSLFVAVSVSIIMNLISGSSRLMITIISSGRASSTSVMLIMITMMMFSSSSVNIIFLRRRISSGSSMIIIIMMIRTTTLLIIISN